MLLTLAGRDWESIADQATAIGVVVAFFGVGVTLIMTLRSERLTRAGQQLQREQSESAAARSEAAAALTEEYTRRVVDALETMAAHGGPASAPRPRVRWTLAHHGGDTYILTNVGEAVANGVRVDSDETLPLIDKPEPQNLAPDEAVTFMAAPTLGTRDSTITVHWSDAASSEDRTWKYPLPGRPPRR